MVLRNQAPGTHTGRVSQESYASLLPWQLLSLTAHPHTAIKSHTRPGAQSSTLSRFRSKVSTSNIPPKLHSGLTPRTSCTLLGWCISVIPQVLICRVQMAKRATQPHPPTGAI
jgi:hypothetical protein